MRGVSCLCLQWALTAHPSPRAQQSPIKIVSETKTYISSDSDPVYWLVVFGWHYGANSKIELVKKVGVNILTLVLLSN